MAQAEVGRAPLSEAYRKLGDALRQLRQAARLTISGVGHIGSGELYSDGYLSRVENGCAPLVIDVVDLYAYQCGASNQQYKNLAELFSKIHSEQSELKFRRHAESKGVDPAILDVIRRHNRPEPTDLYTTELLDVRALCGGNGSLCVVRTIQPLRFGLRSKASIVIASRLHVTMTVDQAS
jgi:hypothetical protein